MHSAHDRGKMRILIVDDCRDSADTLFTLTQLWGHDSMAVYDGSAALELFETVRPEVMLVDIDTPGIAGNRIGRAVDRLGGPRPTLVAVSGFGDRAHRRAAAEAGFDHYLIKPIEPPVLEQFLHAICATRRPVLPAPALTA